MRCGWKLKCNGYAVAGALALSCVEAVGLRAVGFDIGFYTSQITVGSFLYSVTIIGWLLKKNEMVLCQDLVQVKMRNFSPF